MGLACDCLARILVLRKWPERIEAPSLWSDETVRMRATVPDMLVEMSWCVYLLTCSDGSLYCGMTNDIVARVKKHNEGRGAKYTRGRRPVKLLKVFPVGSKSEALKLEAKIKRMKREEKLKL